MFAMDLFMSVYGMKNTEFLLCIQWCIIHLQEFMKLSLDIFSLDSEHSCSKMVNCSSQAMNVVLVTC